MTLNGQIASSELNKAAILKHKQHNFRRKERFTGMKFVCLFMGLIVGVPG